jgi:hypothetical protein
MAERDGKAILMALAGQRVNGSPFSQTMNRDAGRTGSVLADALMTPSAATQQLLSDLPMPGSPMQPSPRPTFNEGMHGASHAISGRIGGMANSVAQALMLPGKVASGEVPFDPRLGFSGQDPATLNSAADLAGLLTLGSGAVPAQPGTLRMGFGSSPSSNYVRDLSADTPVLYREMSTERANHIINNNLNMGAMGQDRLYWSDVPELARGQGDNTGIRMKMNSAGVQGQIDTTSKPGLAFVQNTGGGREFVTRGGVSFDKVDEVQISPEIFYRRNPEDRLMLNKLNQLVASGKFRTYSPDAFVTVYERVK